VKPEDPEFRQRVTNSFKRQSIMGLIGAELTRIDAGLDRVDAAREHLSAALAEEPGDPFALADLAAISTAGSPEAAEAVRRLDRYVGEADRRWLYGLALRRAGRPDGPSA